jgi:hypothetical protein
MKIVISQWNSAALFERVIGEFYCLVGRLGLNRDSDVQTIIDKVVENHLKTCGFSHHLSIPVFGEIRHGEEIFYDAMVKRIMVALKKIQEANPQIKGVLRVNIIYPVGIEVSWSSRIMMSVESHGLLE